MVVNIYDTANELERQMRETQEYQDLQAAFAKLKADSDAFELFKKFQQSQMQAQQKQMAGQELSEDEIKAVQDLAKEVGQKQSVIALMEVERRVDNMMQELNKVITKPIQDIYQDIMPQKQN
ncbi:YlbF family regulator [Limosilactobacillus ingluviei]|uniref:YlbF family regulator n=1 Tax=Limosilactobacillus ingluviei TaxID=148604 RepID=UPI0002E52F68|nr:YlbF family regulator [Limosilactobacillus ingluviei]MBM6728696.1 YlbF family regulator [Limosilactobacillus ingluviei]MDO4603137.1 YlbF family regulator [Limosilactobacillus ingluviei]HJG50181.1 YlbF family regulator [Limosilactobacillus ingluviei]